MTYQGHANYETWAAKLWMDNEEGSYIYWGEVAEEFLERGQYKDEGEGDPYGLSERLKDEYEEAAPDLDGLYGDLLTAALGDVDWYEIAESLIEDAQERVADEVTA